MNKTKRSLRAMTTEELQAKARELDDAILALQKKIKVASKAIANKAHLIIQGGFPSYADGQDTPMRVLRHCYNEFTEIREERSTLHWELDRRRRVACDRQLIEDGE